MIGFSSKNYIFVIIMSRRDLKIGDLVIFTKYTSSNPMIRCEGIIEYISISPSYHRVYYIDGHKTCNIFKDDEIELDIQSIRELEINKLIN